MSNTAAAKVRLETQLAELEGRRERIAEDLDEPLSRDSSERAIEMDDDQSLAGQAVLITREIDSVKRALTRIENGTYGECVRCGAEIVPKRLDARPHCAFHARAKNINDFCRFPMAAASSILATQVRQRLGGDRLGHHAVGNHSKPVRGGSWRQSMLD